MRIYNSLFTLRIFMHNQLDVFGRYAITFLIKLRLHFHCYRRFSNHLYLKWITGAPKQIARKKNRHLFIEITTANTFRSNGIISGFQSYIVLSTEEILLDVENSSRVISYYLITYGLSFTTVTISLLIDPSAYTIKADACVWMERSYLFYITFVVPCCIFILVNSPFVCH